MTKSLMMTPHLSEVSGVDVDGEVPPSLSKSSGDAVGDLLNDDFLPKGEGALADDDVRFPQASSSSHSLLAGAFGMRFARLALVFAAVM